jgi:hypothetical protein
MQIKYSLPVNQELSLPAKLYEPGIAKEDLELCA